MAVVADSRDSTSTAPRHPIPFKQSRRVHCMLSHPSAVNAELNCPKIADERVLRHQQGCPHISDGNARRTSITVSAHHRRNCNLIAKDAPRRRQEGRCGAVPSRWFYAVPPVPPPASGPAGPHRELHLMAAGRTRYPDRGAIGLDLLARVRLEAHRRFAGAQRTAGRMSSRTIDTSTESQASTSAFRGIHDRTPPVIAPPSWFNAGRQISRRASAAVTPRWESLFGADGDLQSRQFCNLACETAQDGWRHAEALVFGAAVGAPLPIGAVSGRCQGRGDQLVGDRGEGVRGGAVPREYSAASRFRRLFGGY